MVSTLITTLSNLISLGFVNGNSITSSGSAIRISNNLSVVGSVGIGTVSVPATLSVVGDTGIFVQGKTGTNSGVLALVPASGGHQWNIESLNSNSDFRIYDASAVIERLRITSDGNVGIGTTTPRYSLDVNGGVKLGGTGLNLGPISSSFPYLVNSGQTLVGWNKSNGGGETNFIANRAGGNVGGFMFSDYTDAGAVTDIMILTGSGSVGVGTTNPIGRLSVNHGTDRNFGIISDASQLGTSGIAIGSFNDDASLFKPLSIVGSSVSINCNVGIGTTNPVGGNIHIKDATPIVHLEKTGVLNWLFGNIISNNFGIYPDSGPGLATFNIDTLGNVGIGTSSPAPNFAGRTALQISNTSNGAVLRVTGSGSSDVELQSVSGQSYLVTSGSTPLNFGVNNTAYLTIDTSGHSTFLGVTKIKNYTVATLPSASTYSYSIAFVTDANTTAILGLGTTVVGGGSNKVPVYSDGTNWIII